MSDSNLDLEVVESEYASRFINVLQPIAKSLEDYLHGILTDHPRIDRITARAKSVDSFLRKAATTAGSGLKYTEPLEQIQDQLGGRIVVYYLCDVEKVERVVNDYLRAIENQTVVPDSESEFGYFGHHLILRLPTDVIDDSWDEALVPRFFELQIKTMFQHAWSQADHDLGYKPMNRVLTSAHKRKIAYTSAQAWGADHIFNELFSESIVEEIRQG